MADPATSVIAAAILSNLRIYLSSSLVWLCGQQAWFEEVPLFCSTELEPSRSRIVAEVVQFASEISSAGNHNSAIIRVCGLRFRTHHRGPNSDTWWRECLTVLEKSTEQRSSAAVSSTTCRTLTFTRSSQCGNLFLLQPSRPRSASLPYQLQRRRSGTCTPEQKT